MSSRQIKLSVLKLYKKCKHVFGYENYLDVLPRSLRFYFCKRMQTGRYDRPRIVPEERYFLCCGTRDIEDEYHFICICSCYVVIRRKYLHKDLYQNPSMFKFINYLNSWNKVELVKLLMIVKDALAIQNTILKVYYDLPNGL